MYIMPEMIYLGSEEFVSEDHKIVASTIGLCNSNVIDRDTLTAICTAVNRVPIDRIRTITYNQLVEEYDLPMVA